MAYRLLALLLLAALLTGCAATKPKETGATPAVIPTAEAASAQKTTGYGFYFDTVVTLTLYGAPEGLMDEALAACARYEQLLSKTVEGSDVWRVNHAEGKSVQVDAETWEILRRGQEISAASGGAFSMTIAPITEMWDFTDGTKRMPTQAQLDAALPLVDDSAILLGEGNMVTLPAGVQVDLGGIAKGYIADQLAALLQGRCMGAIISLGGNTYVVGDKPDGSMNTVGVQDPFAMSGSLEGVLFVKNVSVVTSGTYERGFEGADGKWYHHILDPKTGISVETDLVSASLVMASSMTADALATAFIVLGSEDAMKLAESLGVDAAFITADGRTLFTEGFQEKYFYMTYEEYVAYVTALAQ